MVAKDNEEKEIAAIQVRFAMPRKKKEPSPPPAPERSIKCAFCQKELDPQKDEITFIGMGKWRDGPGLFHAVCSARTPENEDNPCLQSGVAWATKFAKNEPVLFTYEQWKARPIRRKVMAIRSAKGRYEVYLTESHLNAVYILETKHAANAEKAKEIVTQWQSQWSISVEDSADVDEIETKARQSERNSSFPSALSNLEQALSQEKKGELPSELVAELDRLAKTQARHRKKNILTNGDNCKACRIGRGIEKLILYTTYGPLLAAYEEAAEEVSQMPFAARGMMDQYLKPMKAIKKTLYDGLDLKDDDDKHNEQAMKRNFGEMKLALEMMAKHSIKPSGGEQLS